MGICCEGSQGQTSSAVLLHDDDDDDDDDDDKAMSILRRKILQSPSNTGWSKPESLRSPA